MKHCLVLLALGIGLGIAPQISHAGVIVFTATLAPEAIGATGTGFARVEFDIVAHTMALNVTFSGLSGNTTVAHIHGPTALPGTGTAAVMTTTPTFIGFPTGVKSGTFSSTLNTSLATTYRSGFITSSGGIPQAEAALYSSLLAGKAYLNIHTATFPGGEIRGFLQPIPEPSSLASLAIGAVGLLLGRRFVKRK